MFLQQGFQSIMVFPEPGLVSLKYFSVLAFGHHHLNRSGKSLRYLSQAAYPVYILHMIFLYLGSALIFPLAIDVKLQYVLVLLFTLTGCFGVYEIIRRVKVLSWLFGVRISNAELNHRS